MSRCSKTKIKGASRELADDSRRRSLAAIHISRLLKYHERVERRTSEDLIREETILPEKRQKTRTDKLNVSRNEACSLRSTAHDQWNIVIDEVTLKLTVNKQ